MPLLDAVAASPRAISQMRSPSDMPENPSDFLIIHITNIRLLN
jgi:hypothetical protein